MNSQFHCPSDLSLGKGHMLRAFMYTDYSISPHDHDFYEMNIVMNGKGTHQIENARFDVKTGDVFMIPPTTVHAYFDTEGLDVYHILLHREFIAANRAEANAMPGFVQFTEIEPYLRRHFSEAMFLSLTPAELIEVKSELAFIEDGGRFDRKELYPIKHHAAWILLYHLSHLFSQYGYAKSNRSKSKYESSVMSALEYIHRNYTEKITVDSLCQITFLSRSTLFRAFSEMCGCTPIEYLHRYRCKKALELIREAQISKTEIAHACGFYDLSHMERMLKREG